MSFQIEYSFFYLIPCVLLAVAYAWILYQKNAPWNKVVNWGLSGLRFLLVLILSILLLGPYAKQLTRTTEKPVVAIAIDNSQSMALVNSEEELTAAKTSLYQLTSALSEAGVESAVYDLSQSIEPDSLQAMPFQATSSDLSGLLRNVQNDFENRQLSGVIMFTDGIYNQGAAPSYMPQATAIYPVAIGDTLPQRDVSLSALYANKIAYLGNKFPLVAELQHTGFQGKAVAVSLIHKGKVIAQKTAVLDNSAITSVEFLTEAKTEGTQRYIVRAQPLEGEFTSKNNSKTAYLDVLDSREKILLIAASPHPDIKALKSAIEKQKNYELKVHIPVLSATNQQNPVNLEDKYDLVILHQVPSITRQAAALAQKFVEDGSALWCILGKQSNLAAFNRLNIGGIQIASQGQQRDRVTPIFNNNFNRFTFKAEAIASLTKFPPVWVPFGNYQLSPNTETILSQRVGSVATEKPLLTVQTGEKRKVAVMMGEGLWEWRLQDYAINQNHEAFDALVGKLVQYLSTKEDKRRFRVYPNSNEMLNTDRVTFETEVYNDIYEEVFGQNINLSIKNEKGEEKSYTYVNVGANFRYIVRGLEEGVYEYTASTVINGTKESSSGQFSLRSQELEALNTTANFSMLRQLAKQSGGDFYTPQQLDQLQQRLIENRDPDVIYTDEVSVSLLHAWWPFALLMLLAALEWGIRKFKGGY